MSALPPASGPRLAFMPPAVSGTPRRCRATTRHIQPHSVWSVGIQCKYERGHDGDHAGTAVGIMFGDIFWRASVERE